MSEITLAPVTDENEADVIALAVREDQKSYVASNQRSLEQAEADDGAWPRAILADGVPVGFVMLHDETLLEEPEVAGYIYLWRMMIDARHQGKGYGSEAMKAVADYARTRPDATRIVSSYVEGDHSAAGFYERVGFKKTGEIVGGETEIELIL